MCARVRMNTRPPPSNRLFSRIRPWRSSTLPLLLPPCFFCSCRKFERNSCASYSDLRKMEKNKKRQTTSQPLQSHSVLRLNLRQSLEIFFLRMNHCLRFSACDSLLLCPPGRVRACVHVRERGLHLFPCNHPLVSHPLRARVSGSHGGI